MSYVIYKNNGEKLTVVDDGTINQSTDLTLIGRNYPSYGQVLDQNFIKLLENFAGSKTPAKPMIGQLWYDTASKKMRFYNGVGFKSVPQIVSQDVQPTDQAEGDMWFFKQEQKLYFFDGSTYSLIGPQFSGRSALNAMVPALVYDIDNYQHYVLKHNVENIATGVVDCVAITSTDEFELNTTTIPGFRFIKKGINLINTTNGISATSDTGGAMIWGSSSNSLRLGGTLATSYVTKDAPNFTAALTISGVSAGSAIDINSGGLKVQVSAASTATIVAGGNRVTLSVNGSGTPLDAINIDGSSGLKVLPSLSAGQAVDLGSIQYAFNELHVTDIYSDTFVGTSVRSGTVITGSLSTSTNGTITGNWSLATGSKLNASYADLAEKYKSDADYEPGTVLRIGGKEEVTICNMYQDEQVAGIVSTNPAYTMNEDLAGGVLIALKGRVPCKVKGNVKKGQILVTSDFPGHAEVRREQLRPNELGVVGKALQDFTGDFGVIEVMVY